ncbi:hypothetical protein [Halomarina pelagica]|uniref:hypothetical protein n=1 Tax=Halomarina pelagica TaxID=2961599 RepID=UPI0020C1BD3F|nr:hypothetical protein [Halomarina sp. BND7]
MAGRNVTDRRGGMPQACDGCGQIKRDVRRVRVPGATLRRVLCPECRADRA